MTARSGSFLSTPRTASARARQVPTRSDATDRSIAERLREARSALVQDLSTRGVAFGRVLAEAVDDALKEAFAAHAQRSEVALVALGSYGRRELCPGSDVDVLLIHSMRGRRSADEVRAIAEALWYPLWDAGFVTGHGARTVKDSIALADSDIDALTALLEVRHIAGNVDLSAELERKARELAHRRRDRILRSLADAAEVRRIRPGPVAEMLEPDLKEGAGGLRDAHALGWAGWTFGDPGSTEALTARGYLAPEDVQRVDAGGALLLDIRVALQRVTATRSDRLALQEQDAVANALGYADADALVRDLARVARGIAWASADVWLRVRDALAGPGGRAGGSGHAIADGVVLRDGRVHLDADADGTVPTLRMLEAAVAAAEHDVAFDRPSLARLQHVVPPSWDVWERAAFLRLLRTGENAVKVFEALDHEGALTVLLPEWEHVRSRPQRNAYHRFTVDRHLLEAVAQCARLLDAGDRGDFPTADVDAMVARSCRRPELLLLGALLHDIAKGMPGDHSEVGAESAANIARRIGLDSEGREILVWLVRNHLLMAEVATRRDLTDVSVLDNLADRCARDPERLRLLYLLTIGDSYATGPAAWSPSKAALVRDLFIKAAAAIERGESRAVAADRRVALHDRIGEERANALLARLPDAYVLAFDADDMARHDELLRERQAVHCEVHEGHVRVTVVTPDRRGLLATLAGALTLCGLDVLEANVFVTNDGFALDVFSATDPFGRVDDDGGTVARTINDALAGTLDLGARVEERRRAYTRPGTTAGPLYVDVDANASATDIVVEVHADDEIGLLYEVASAFADLAVDVRVAKVATLGRRVVDVFYVRATDAAKADGGEKLRAELLRRITR